MKLPITTLLTVLLVVVSFEAASECSEKTIELIKSSSKALGNLPGSAGGGVKDKAIAFVEFALRDNPDIRDRKIALMRACTDSDLASINPKPKASQSGSAGSNCPDEITVGHVAFKHLGQGRFMCGPSNPAYGSLDRCTDLEDTLSLEGSPRGLNEIERQRAVAWAKCHVAAYKGVGSSSNPPNANTRHTGSAASNCPSEYSWPFSAGCGSKLRVLPNGHLLYNGCPEAGDPWKDEGPIGASNDRRGLGWRGLDEFYECHLAARKGSSVTASAGAASTQTGANVGNASEVIGQRSNRKNTFNPNSPNGDSARNHPGASDGECKNGDPSCAIRGCNRSGGKAITYRNNLGCGVVSCRFSDSKYDWSSVYNNIPGSGCAGSTK